MERSFYHRAAAALTERGECEEVESAKLKVATREEVR